MVLAGFSPFAERVAKGRSVNAIVADMTHRHGAGAEMRQALGTAVFSGMLGAPILGLFLTPVFDAAIRSWFTRRPRPAASAHSVAGHG